MNVLIENATFYLRPPPEYSIITVNGTVITEAYIVGRTVNNRYFNITYSAKLINHLNYGWNAVTATCSLRKSRKVLKHYTFAPHNKGFCDEIDVNMDYSTMILKAPDWTISVSPRPVYDRIDGAHHRLDLKIELETSESKLPTMPHGIIGQSWDGDNLAVDGNLDEYPHVNGSQFTTYALAEGAIEGNASDYVMSTPFELNYKYSRFGTYNHPARDKALFTKRVGTQTESVGADIEEESRSKNSLMP